MNTSYEHGLRARYQCCGPLLQSRRSYSGTGERGAQSLPALGELFYGAEHSHNVANSLTEVEELAKLTNVLGTDLETARVFGRLKHQQRTKGLMLSDNDLWIAATAIHYGLTLAARDAHFTWVDEVDGLAQEQW